MEPNMHEIEDYNGKESLKHKRVVNLTITILFGIASLYAFAKLSLSNVSDELIVHKSEMAISPTNLK